MDAPTKSATPSGVPPPTIDEVLQKEFAQVATSRNLRLPPDEGTIRPEQSSIGLAFSGGGIRSATFNLGILQALAKSKLLHKFDYLSTVSGGGYIGGWLMAWMKHQDIGIKEIEERLSTPPKSPQEGADQPEVHFLRDYSNYLTPRKGILGADFLAFLASYLRNTMLNQVILVLALLSLLLVPRTIVYLLHLLDHTANHLQQLNLAWYPDCLTAQGIAIGLGVALAGLAIICIGLNLVTVEPIKRESPGREEAARKTKTVTALPARRRSGCWFEQQWAVQLCIVIPLVLAAALFTDRFGQFVIRWGILNHPWSLPPLIGLTIYFGQWAGACWVMDLALYFFGKRYRLTSTNAPTEWIVLLTAAITGTAVGYLFLPFAHLLISPDGLPYRKWHLMAFGVPVEIVIMLLAGVLHIGLMGRDFRDAHREWWGRLGGWLLLYALGWFFLFQIAIYFPWALGRLYHWEVLRHGSHPVTISSVALWAVSTAYGVLFGKSKDTSEMLSGDKWKEKLPAYIARITPYIFILGMLLALSLFADVLAVRIAGDGKSFLRHPDEWAYSVRVPVLCAGLFVVALLFSWRVDINEFSIHYLYRNRLIRCYLGASVPERHGQPFTGFSEDDNLPLASLSIPAGATDEKHGRPLPIFNTSLNVVRGKELALQTRKARSFAFTPALSGFTRARTDQREWQAFYGPTCKGASKMLGAPQGITLGTAVAVSGAAASPNMGSYSQPALSFLMTIFDVRLGWWIGNPGKKYWSSGSPKVGFYWLLRELLGSTNDDSDFVYLSDGGHFENLAVYELVRRRCKLIVACDASCDPEYKFGDLHNAMERCRTDFGVDISFSQLAPLYPSAEAATPGCKRAQEHFAVGNIHYPQSDVEDGKIIYIKPNLVEGDPRDVLAYADIDKQFPHDSTANQWFDESHFESYRALGEAAGAAAGVVIQPEIRKVLGPETADEGL
jgi:predicted acylesterase/phospholipase RssA